MPLGFNTFGNDRHAQALGQIDDGLHNGCIIQIMRQVFHETAFDLEPVDGKTLQIIQTGITSSEIVDGQSDAHFMELVEGRRSTPWVAHDCVLGNLDLDVARADAMTGERCRHALGQTAVVKLERGKIEGNRDRFQPLAVPVRDLTAGFIEHPFVNQLDGVGFLGQRNEVARIQQPVFAVFPAHQRLGSDELVSGGIELRLIVEQELIALDGFSQLTRERQSLRPRGVQFRCKKGEAVAPAFL